MVFPKLSATAPRKSHKSTSPCYDTFIPYQLLVTEIETLYASSINQEHGNVTGLDTFLITLDQ